MHCLVAELLKQSLKHTPLVLLLTLSKFVCKRIEAKAESYSTCTPTCALQCYHTTIGAKSDSYSTLSLHLLMQPSHCIPCLQERVASRRGHQALPKTQSSALRKASAGVPSHQSHISKSAMQQLLQAGVPAQLLQQVQASQQEASSPDGTPPAGRGPGGGSRHSTKPEGQARPKQGRQRSCGEDAGVSDRACLLKARQEAILKRIRCLEGAQAQSSHQHDDSSVSGGGLVWERVKPTLKVGC